MPNPGNTRIKNERVNLNKDSVHSFFDKRAEKPLYHRYNMVNYQDHNPTLALRRDQIEKEVITKYLHFSESARILDIGCGVGRWGDTVVPLLQSGIYVGVDFSSALLDVARAHFAGEEHALFVNSSFQSVKQALASKGIDNQFEFVLINGVLMYINDDELDGCLQSARELLKPGGYIYIKEPVATAARLTLNGFYSDDLLSEYSAIYRSLREYTTIIRDEFLEHDFSIISCGPSWNEDYNEAKETYNAYWIMRKDKQL